MKTDIILVIPFFVVISEDKKVSNYVLCALINSKIINAYVRRECVKRTLTTSVVRSIPVPEFSDVQISKIEQCYLSIKRLMHWMIRKSRGSSGKN